MYPVLIGVVAVSLIVLIGALFVLVVGEAIQVTRSVRASRRRSRARTDANP